MNEADLMRLAIETGGSVRTIRRWMNRESVSKFAEYACDVAARKLRIKRRAVRQKASNKK